MVPRPQMRGFTASRFKRDMIITFVACVATVVAHRVLIVAPHRQRYADFYKCYDAEEDFQRMKAKGVFQSCGPDDE